MTATAQPVRCYTRVRGAHGSLEKNKYLAVIAMNQKGVILFVENDVHNGVHDSLRNCNFLRSGQFDDPVTDIICLHEGSELSRKVFVNEGSVRHQ